MGDVFVKVVELEQEVIKLKELNREMLAALRFCYKMLKGGSESINDDNGESELTLESGDEWVHCMTIIEQIVNNVGEGNH